MKFIKFSLTLLFATCILNFSTDAQKINGYALYNALNNTTTYLIDSNGQIAHTWNCALRCNYSVLLKPNGNIVRGAVNPGNSINGAAVGGRIQELDKNANVVWEFTYSSSQVVQHHDISLMPNGNVLITAWERKDLTEMQAAGYTGNATYLYVVHFVEVQQDGTGGKIVWEWHMWDHLVQDMDNTKANYGKLVDHPELMNVNVNTGSSRSGDWLHVNGVDYNDSLDQIAFSSRFLSEIFIIDHSTTTAEAAGHSGGNSGKGGDLLYRWGNPQNWNGPGTQQISGPCHDVRWIDSGRPNAGYLQFFNNDGVGGNSTVDAVQTPINGYNYTLSPTTGYAPSTVSWRHNCIANASGQSASNRMSNGNVFVNLSGKYMYEADTNGNTVFQYNARSAKAFRYECDYPGLTALLGNNPCGGNVGQELLDLEIVKIFPNPSAGIFEISGMRLGYTVEEINVFDLYGKLVRHYDRYTQIDLSSEASGLYTASIKFENGQQYTQKIALVRE